jgi:hypothetical protein
MVAQKSNTPPEALIQLADDNYWWIRRGVARNPNTPVSALEKLVDDEQGWVRCEVKNNPNTPQYIKDYLTARDFMKNYGSK